ncbi:MAG: glycosyltransferase [Candidatus Eiseniibacteriota bacterium]
MKIGLLGPAHPLRGGISQYLALLAGELAREHHEVHYLSLLRQYPSFLFPGQSQIDPSENPLRVPNERVLDPMNPLTWRSAGRRARALGLAALVYKWWMPFFGPSYAPVLGGARRGGAVNVMIADNLVPHEKRPFDRAFTRLVLDRTDGYLVMSKAVEDDLLKLVPGARFRRVPHPVYAQYAAEGRDRGDARRRAGLPPDGDVLLFFGFVRRYKGLDVLIEALPRVLARRPVTLVVAGEFYEPVEPVRARIAELGLGESVRVLDRYVPDEDVGDLVAAADLVVLPYRSATQSGVVQVAYAGGCPVVSTAVGGLPEVVFEGRTGHLVPPERPDALADAILGFFDRGGRAAYEPAVREAARAFSWGRVVEGLTELVAELRAGKAA